MNLRSLLIILFVSVFCCHHAFPTTRNILLSDCSGIEQNKSFSVTGKVTDAATNLPVSGVMIILKSAAGRILRYGVSNSYGDYALDFATFPENGSLSFHMLGYVQQIYKVSMHGNTDIPASGTGSKEGKNKDVDGLLASCSNNLQVKLVIDAIRLKEVYVKPASITMSEDTLRYNVQSFAQVQDKNIGEVLKRMPGIQVMENGEIRYNGEPISNFYINGKDMLGGRYGLATKNISPGDVAKVEVLENHQPIKALRNRVYSDKSALNIKLKDSAKAKWRSSLNLDVGYADSSLVRKYSPAYNLGLFSMNIGGRSNWIISAKTNNIGLPLSDELSSYGSYVNLGEKNLTLSNYFAGSPSLSPLNEKRNRLGNTQLFNITNTSNLSEDYQLTTNAYYLRDKLKSVAASRVSYFLSDSDTRVIEEEESAGQLINKANIDVKLSANANSYYMTNQLSGNMIWESTDIDISGTNHNSQKFSMPHYLLNNLFNYVRRSGNNTFTINSANKFIYDPQRISVLKYPDNSTTTPVGAGTSISDKAYKRAFYSETSLSAGKSLNNMSIYLKSGVGVLHRKLETDNLSSKFGYFKLYTEPIMYYSINKVNLELKAPFNYYRYSGGAGKNLFYCTPAFLVKYSASAKLNFRVGVSLGRSEIDEHHFFNGEIMTNYMEIMRGDNLYADTRSVNYYFSSAYKNPINSFFLNATLGYSRNKAGLSRVRDYRDDYFIYYYELGNNRSDVLYINAMAGKGIDFLKANLSVEFSYSDSQSQLTQNGEATGYRMRNYTITPKFNGQFAQWWLFDYKMLMRTSKMITKSYNQSSYGYSQFLSFNITLCKKVDIRLSADHYHNKLSNDQVKDFVIADVSLKYMLSKDIDLKLNVDNLLNRREYSYSSIGSLSKAIYSFSIRPRTATAGLYVKF